MTQTFDDWSGTANNNITVGSGAVDIDEGCAPGNVNNGMREIMAACVYSAGMAGLSGSGSRPSGTQANQFWTDTATAGAPKIYWYDGTDNILFATVSNSGNTITLSSSVSTSLELVNDTSPQLGGDLDLNGNGIIFPGATITDVTGADTLVVSGTAGTSGDFAIWNADGDLVDGPTPTGADDGVVTGTAGTSGNVAIWNSDGDLVDGGTTPGGGFSSQLLHVQDQKTATDGGDFTSGAWRTRTLNTTVTNEISGASRSSNVIALPAGTYYIEARAPCYSTSSGNPHKAKLRNTSDSTDVLIGSSGGGQDAQTDSIIKGRFTIAGAKNFEIQHQIGTTQSTNGFGISGGFSVTDVYTQVFIWKVG